MAQTQGPCGYGHLALGPPCIVRRAQVTLATGACGYIHHEKKTQKDDK